MNQNSRTSRHRSTHELARFSITLTNPKPSGWLSGLYVRAPSEAWRFPLGE